MFFFANIDLSIPSIYYCFFHQLLFFSINGYNNPIQWFIVDLPIKNGDFPISYVNVYQRVGQ